jgi:hypothetical protein
MTAVLVLSTLPGDLSLDRAVTIADLIDLASHFNAPAAAKLEAS